MSDREPTQRPGGRSGMSVSGTLSIIVAAVAVILGFLILRDINDSGEASGGGDPVTTTTLAGGPNNTGEDPEQSTTTVAPTLQDYTVIVANAAKKGGAAGEMTTALQGAGVSTEAGINSSLAAAESTTTIYYLPGFENEAADLARIMGVTSAPQAMPDPPPIESGKTLGAAQLLVQLGLDKAGQPLPAGTSSTDSTSSTVATATT